MKKLFLLGIAFIMLFSLTACQDNELADYKTAAKTTIETHAQSNGQSNYITENWAIINGLITTGKTAIDAAADKATVDFAVDTVKQAINGIPQDEEMRDFETDKLSVILKITSIMDNRDITLADFSEVSKIVGLESVTESMRYVDFETTPLINPNGNRLLKIILKEAFQSKENILMAAAAFKKLDIVLDVGLYYTDVSVGVG